MNRAEGLTKRNVSKKKDEASGFSEDKGELGDWDHLDDDDLGKDEEDDHESKDMKLTLMEEVLLMGLKDREVSSKLLTLTLTLSYSPYLDTTL